MSASDQPSPIEPRRRISNIVATSPGSEPLRAMYDAAVAAKPISWAQIAAEFLAAMEGFDQNIADGTAAMGDLQNGKGDFFNDLLALLLENSADVSLYSRRRVPGLVFPTNNLDVTYPAAGDVEFLIEAKVLGTPKYPGNPRAKPLGRPGSADIDKRVKELGLKAIDLKGEYARIQASRGVRSQRVSGNLITWLHSVKPKIYLFIAARVISPTDFNALMRSANRATKLVDAVGVYCFQPVSADEPTRYEEVEVPDHLELDRVLHGAANDLAALASTVEDKSPTNSPSAHDQSGVDEGPRP